MTEEWGAGFKVGLWVGAGFTWAFMFVWHLWWVRRDARRGNVTHWGR
jgi:hypothetical protein